MILHPGHSDLRVLIRIKNGLDASSISIKTMSGQGPSQFLGISSTLLIWQHKEIAGSWLSA